MGQLDYKCWGHMFRSTRKDGESWTVETSKTMALREEVLEKEPKRIGRIMERIKEKEIEERTKIKMVKRSLV